MSHTKRKCWHSKVLAMAVSAALAGKAHATRSVGIDVSHYQTNINWPSVKAAGTDFAWIKSTEGFTYNDPDFTTSMPNALSAGVIAGAYHLARPDNNSATDEASHFVSIAGPYLKPGALRPALDLEYAYISSFSQSYLQSWITEWCTDVFNATGVQPVIYSGGQASTANLIATSITSAYPLWFARYPTTVNPQTDVPGSTHYTPWTNWSFWQYSDTSTVAGISGAIDADVANGDLTYVESFAIGAVWRTGVAGNWSDTTKWLGGTPATLDDTLFKAASSSGYTVTLTGASSARDLIVDTDKPTVSLSGNTLTLGRHMRIGDESGNNGVLTINGPGSISMSTGSVSVGVAGNGTLLIRNGAVVNSASGDIGRVSPAKGYVAIGGTGTGAWNVSGSLNIANTSAAGGSIDLLAGGSLNVGGTMTVYSSFGTVNFSGGTFKAGAINLTNGRINVASGGGKVVQAGSVSITGTGKIDLADNSMIVDYTGASPINSIRTLLSTGRGTGNWTGNGISSTSAASVFADNSNPHKTALGFAEASSIGATTFAGVTLADSSAILIGYTYLGDANLDGKVNALDFNALATNFGANGSEQLLDERGFQLRRRREHLGLRTSAAYSACQVRPDLASRGSPLTPSTGRQPARQRPTCQSCGGEGDGRYTTLRGLDGLTVSEGDGQRERAPRHRSGWAIPVR